MRKFSGFVLISLFILAGTNFNKVKKQVYNELYLIMTSQEQEQFKSINTPVQLQMFVEEFWKKRDPDPKTPQNKIRELYYARLKFSARYFREPGKPGWLTDRGRIFVILGPPTNRYTKDMGVQSGGSNTNPLEEDSVTMAQKSKNLGIGEGKGINKEKWKYEDLNLEIIFLDRMGIGKFKIFNPPPKLISLFEKSKKQFLPRNPIGKELHISAEVDTNGKKLYIHIPLQEISFITENRKHYADILLYFSYTNTKTNIEKHFTQEMKFPVKQEDINDPEKRITIPINIAPLKGVYFIEITIKDRISGAEGVKRYKLKI